MRNIEIKARLADAEAARKVAARLAGAGPERIPQSDFFFAVPSGRLKLRILAPDQGELIHYHRADVAEPRASDYRIARTPDPQALLEMLSTALSPSGTVRKTRRLYVVGETRIHIDEVEGLGDFLELEVVLRPGQTDAEGRAVAEAILREFDLAPDAVVSKAYIDLLAG